MKHEEHGDGSVTWRGGGWFWATLGTQGELLGSPEGAESRPSWRGFLKDVRKRHRALMAEPSVEATLIERRKK